MRHDHDDHDGLDESGFEPHGLRLRSRSLWAGLGVALLSFIPYEVIDERPQLAWDLLGELPPAAIIAVWAPALIGVLAALAGRVVRREADLGVVIGALLLGGGALIGLGMEAQAWSAMPTPDGINLSPTWAVLALALPAAGASLTATPEARWRGRALVLLGVPAAMAFYLIPRGGSPLGVQIYHFIEFQVRWVHGFAYFGTFTLALALYWPAVMATLGLTYLIRPARDEAPILSLAATFGFSIFWMIWALRSLLSGATAWDAFTMIGMAIVLASAVAIIASTLATLGAMERPRRPLLVKVGVGLALVIIAQAILASPPRKGVDWTLEPRSEGGDALYATQLPEWNRARLNWLQEGTAEAYLRLRDSEASLLKGAAAVDAQLEAAIRGLVGVAWEAGLAGRAWARAVARVNDAAQAIGAPYYLDPMVYFFKRGEGMRRHFQLKTYAVEAVDAVEADGRRFATLHVVRLDRGGARGALLGFSRDAQPFAIVQRAEIDEFEGTLERLSRETIPRCVEGRMEGNYECGARLVELIDAGALEGLDAIVSRHELQHQIDGPGLPISRIFRRLNRDLGARRLERLNRELSAYTAELLADEGSPHLSLILTLRAAKQGGGLARVARLIILELWRPGAVAGQETLGAQEAQLAEAFSGLMALDEAALRARAKSLWGRLFSMDLVDVEAGEGA